MKELDLGTFKTCKFEDYLLLALSKKWVLLNGGKPLEFEAKIEKNQLVLSASLVANQDKTNSNLGETD